MALQKFVATLDKENFDLLSRLMKMLHEISLKEEINQMSPNNLSIVFGPNLAREKAVQNDDPMAEISFAGGDVIETMIKEYRTIFSSFRRAAPPPTRTNSFIAGKIRVLGTNRVQATVSDSPISISSSRNSIFPSTKELESVNTKLSRKKSLMSQQKSLPSFANRSNIVINEPSPSESPETSASPSDSPRSHESSNSPASKSKRSGASRSKSKSRERKQRKRGLEKSSPSLLSSTSSVEGLNDSP